MMYTHVLVYFFQATLVRTLRGHTRSVLSVDYHPKDEAVLISGSSDGTVIVWRQSDEEKGAAMELLQAGMVGPTGPPVVGPMLPPAN